MSISSMMVFRSSTMGVDCGVSWVIGSGNKVRVRLVWLVVDDYLCIHRFNYVDVYTNCYLFHVFIH